MSNDAFLKQRNLGHGTPRLADQGRRRQEAGKRGEGGGRLVAGKFDAFWPGEVPIWINISAYSFYEQEVYDKKERKVIQTATTWFEWQKHYVPRNKGRTDRHGKKVDKDFVCSSGAHKDRPCWGDAVRHNHFAMLDKIEEEKGFRPDKAAPVSRIDQFSLAVTVMEKIYAVPLRDNQGMIRKAKSNGQIIYRYIPAPIAEVRTEDPTELSNFKYQFGHRMHWTLGAEDLGWLIEMDDKMKNRCGTCAEALYATHMICPGCESLTALNGAVSGVDLAMERRKVRVCGLCGEKGPFEPKIECAECGTPVEGRLTSFDIRITRTKTGDRYVSEIVAIRVPGVPGNKEDHDRAMELIQNPLDLAAIFAPTPLDRQKFILGEELTEGIKPTDGMKKKDDAEDNTETESYADNDGVDDEGRTIDFS